MTKYAAAVFALSICASAISAAHAQTMTPAPDAFVRSSDPRGRPGDFFNRHSVSQWRADYVLQKSREAPMSGGFGCDHVAYVAFARVLPDRNFLHQLEPTSGGDYDQRADRIQKYRIDHGDMSAIYVFGCWKKIADYGDFDRADTIWKIPAASAVQRCEVSLGPNGRAICY
jgi:hypothetical protein